MRETSSEINYPAVVYQRDFLFSDNEPNPMKGFTTSLNTTVRQPKGEGLTSMSIIVGTSKSSFISRATFVFQGSFFFWLFYRLFSLLLVLFFLFF